MRLPVALLFTIPAYSRGLCADDSRQALVHSTTIWGLYVPAPVTVRGEQANLDTPKLGLGRRRRYGGSGPRNLCTRNLRFPYKFYGERFRRLEPISDNTNVAP